MARLGIRVYWTESPIGSYSEAGTVAEASRAAVDQALITHTKGGGGVAVGGGYIYWTNYGSGVDGSGTIGRSNLNGTHVDQRFIVGASSPVGVAVYGQYLYWSNSVMLTIGRARIDGSGVNQRFIVLADGAAIDGLAVNSRYVYWADVGSNQIGRADLDGSRVDDAFISGADAPDGVSATSNYLYWSNSGEGSIGRSLLDGSGVNQRCVVLGRPIGNEAEDVQAVGGKVYWTSYPGNAIGQSNLNGGAVHNAFIRARGVPEGIAVLRHGSVSLGGNSHCVASPEPIYLGTRPRLDMAVGWGEVAPPILSNGGASASGTISAISWSAWGGPVATGQGLNPAFKPGGGYYSKPAVIQLRLSNIERCSAGAGLSYATLSTREQDVPGGPFGSWFTVPVDLCHGYGI